MKKSTIILTLILWVTVVFFVFTTMILKYTGADFSEYTLKEQSDSVCADTKNVDYGDTRVEEKEADTKNVDYYDTVCEKDISDFIHKQLSRFDNEVTIEEKEELKEIEADTIDVDYGDMTIKQIEADLSKSYNKMRSHSIRAYNCGDGYDDSLDKESKIFRKKFLAYTSTYPKTFTCKFDLLQKKYNLHLQTSDDNLFRLYSWNLLCTSTMQGYEAIAQFKSGKNVYSKLYYDDAYNGEGVYVPFYSQIFTFKNRNKTYYLAIGTGIYSGVSLSQSIKAFTIENNSLNDTIKLFKTKTKLLNEIGFYFESYNVYDDAERPYRLIKYDKNKKTIYIPIVIEGGEVTNKYILYKFNGQYFERIGAEDTSKLENCYIEK